MCDEPEAVPPADLTDPDTRRRFSAAGRGGFENIAKHWNLTDAEMHALVPGYEDDPLSEDALTRISHLMNIYTALVMFFGDSLGLEWMTLPNTGPLCNGARPVDWLTQGGLAEFELLHRDLMGAAYYGH